MAQLDPQDLAKILRQALPTAQATQQAIQNIASEINKSLTSTANATQRLIQSLSFGDEIVEKMAENFDKIKNAVNGTKLGAQVFDRKIMKDFEERFSAARTIVDQLKDEVIRLQTNLRGISALDPTGTIINVDQIKADLAAATLALNYRIKSAEAIQNEAEAYVDLNQKQKAFNQSLESKSGFNAFESSLGIFGKIPTVARGLEQLSLRAKMTIGIIYSVFQTVYDTFDQTQTAFIKTIKSFGLLKDEAEKLNTFIKNTAVNLAKYGVTAEDAAATVTNMVDAFGSLTLFSEKTGEDITLISKQLGVGNKELTDSLMTLMSFGKIDMVKATKVVYFASALSKAAGVPLAKVMEDVAKAGDKARGMIQGGAEQLVKAAVYARRLGTDLEKVAEIGRKMLDFQESITDEIEASVLFGSNISFQKARELFYTGKIQEGYDEIFKVVKSIGDFNKLDIFQKEAIAKATGLSLTDLQKQVQIREDLSALEISGTEKQKEMVREYRKLTEQSGSMLENTAAAQEQRVKELINLKQTEEITARIRGLFLSISSHVLPIIEGTLKGINLLLEVLDTTLGKIFLAGGALYLAIGSFKKIKALYFDLRGVFVAIRGASAAVTSQLAIQTAATKTAAVSQTILNNTASAPVGKGGFMSSLMSIDYKTLLSLSVIMISFAGALYILAKAGQEFNSVDWESMGKLGTAAVGLTALTLAIVGLSTVIDASFEVILPAAAIIGVLALAMLGLGKAAQLVGQGTKNFGEGLKFAVDALKDFGQNVSIIDSAKLTGLFSAINSSIRDFDLSRLQSIVSAMQSLAASLNSISAFKGIPQLTLPTNAVNTTNVPTVLTNTPVISPVQTNVQTTNTPTTNSTTMIDAVKQGIKEGMNNISLNVYLDGQKMVTGLSKNVGFRQDTGGIAMQSSLT
jgi:hypothetical protein